MTRVDDQPAAADATTFERDSTAWGLGDPGVVRREPWNFAVLAAHLVMVRVGWIFKTESVIVPAFMDMIGGAAWQRGLLPVLNRFGQSVPPALWANRLERSPRMKRSLAGWTLVMGAMFLLLSAQWFAAGRQPRPWMPWSFLLLYAIFGGANGISGLSYNALQGKLIHPTRRGRLLAVGTGLGVVPAVICAWFLLGRWLTLPDHGFGIVFLFAGSCFGVAGLVAALLVEPAEPHGAPAGSWRESLAASWHVLRNDPALQGLAVVTALSAITLMLFPHYQALGSQELGLSGVHLMWWVVVQNLGTGVGSALAGPLADRRGTRLALRVLIFANALVPLAACGLSAWPEAGRRWFWVVFALMGLIPVANKTLTNYTLEIAPPDRHALYVAAMNLCIAAPFLLSPVVGWLIDVTSFRTVMLGGAALIATAGLATFRLVEPRNAANGAP